MRIAHQHLGIFVSCDEATLSYPFPKIQNPENTSAFGVN